MINYLTILEWVATISSLTGAILASANIGNKTWPWKLWISGNILFIVMFVSTGHMGLLVLHLFGLFINSLGYYQHNTKNGNFNSKKIMHIFFYFSVLLSILSFVYAIKFNQSNANDISSLEWSGTFAGIAGALLLASKHKLSHLCWYIWAFGNMIVLILCLFYTKQYGVLSLQVGFMITNLMGIYSNFKINKKLPGISEKHGPFRSVMDS